MSDLEELVKISEVPAPYMDSINLLRKFYRERIIDAKVKIAVKLIEKLK